MADIKSRDVLLAEMREFLRVWNRSLDTSDNSLSKDLLLTPYSVGGKAVMDQVEIARDLHVLSRLESGDLDNEGTNYTRERLSGTYSIVTLTFYTETAPTTDIVIPATTQATTAGTSFASPISFSTVVEARFAATDAAAYYSHDRSRYEFQVTGLCDTIGSAGRLGAGLITQLVGSITGITGVTNLTGATGGLDEESDDDYMERIRLAKLGRDINTTNGLRKFMRDTGFLDAYPVRVESVDSEKATGVDVFVINSSSEAATDTFTYDPAQQYYYLTSRPVLTVASVVGSNLGILPSSAYSVNIDSTTELRRSIYSQDYIRIPGGSGLLTGEQITVSYTYAPLIVQVQATLDLITNEVLTADPLIKRAFPLYLYLNATITLMANADGPTVRSRCRNALSQYVSVYRLGDNLQRSDLIVVLQKGYGDFPITSVDAVVINSYYLQDELGNIYSPVNEIITVGNKYYIVYGAATIV